MYRKSLVKFVLVICVCFAATNADLLAEDYTGPVVGNLFVNDSGAPGTVQVANFLPGAETLGFIQVNSGGEVNLYAGTFDSEFGPDFEGWYELSAAGGVVNVHGTQFSVSGIAVPQDTPYVDINPATTSYPAGDWGYYNIEWTDADENTYNIWADATVPVNLIWLGSQTENQAPVADAGGPYSGTSVDGGPVAVDLTAAASTDPDGQIVEWNWDLDNDGVYETSAMIVNINSFPVGTSTIGLVVVDNLGLASEPVTTTVTVTKLLPEIDVYPAELAHDYGDIEVGVSKTYIVQIVNSGQGNLNISSIALSGSADFAITIAPEPDPVTGDVVIAPDQIASTDIEITYTPSAEGYAATTLTIASDDADEPAVSVALSGVGVIIEVPVEEQIEAAIAFFNQSIADGTILGYAPHQKPNVAENRLKALGNMLEAVGKLIEVGETETALTQLQAIAKKTDGELNPPDFIIGDGVPQLNQMVDDLIDALSL